jgi:N-acyl-D-aspartate/D-glutamate deacylase
MEGIEDIPEPVMSAGLKWNWESFPEFLDAVAERELDMDVAMQLPHAPLRIHVMGDRAAHRERANDDDIAQMAAIAKEAVEAGAMGFTTSRTINHKGSDGVLSPAYSAAEDELTGIALGLKQAGKGVLQLITDFEDHDPEFDMFERIAKASGRPMSISVIQRAAAPETYAATLDRLAEANAKGIEIRGQCANRPTGGLFGLSLRRNAFMFCPSYQTIANLPLEERVKAMRDPALKAKIVSEYPVVDDHPHSQAITWLDKIFELSADEPDYEPVLSNSVAAIAERMGVPVAEYMYDRLIADEGRALFFLPASSYAGYTIDAIARMMAHPNCVHGLGDGGAHLNQICDASQQTYMLTRWARGRHGRQLPLERVVQMMTRDTAEALGFHDRGLLKPGYKADINIIDYDNLKLYSPEVVYDLPSGGGRLFQRASGYRATIVSGQVTQENDQPTGRLPGRLVRGEQPAPAVA